jgi:PAS domain S-box-containing protein
MISTSNLSVLDLLRRRIADLSRSLAERDSVLHECTRHLRVAQSLAHLGSWDWEIESGEVRCSNELYRIFGRDPDVHPMTFEIFVSALVPDDHDRVVAAINDALGGRAHYDVEYRITRLNGEVRTIHCCGEVLRDDHGRPCRMSGSVLDITERKRTEAMLRSSQEKLRQALHASGIGLWDWNTDTNEMALSDEWKRQLGYEETELTDTFETWEALLHPADHGHALAYIQAYMRDRQGEYRQEFRLRHKDGTYRWIEARASFLTEADGLQIRILGSHTDITERKRMEEAARESEDRYRTLVELSPSGVFVFAEGRTVYVNHTGAILMGANDPKELLDRPMTEFIHHKYHEEVRENVKRLLTGSDSVHRAERHYVKMDGTSIPVQVEASRIVWNGKPAILGLISDVTDRKQAEEALRASEERFAKAFQASPHPVVISELDTGLVVDLNEAACQSLGYRKEEVQGYITAEIGVWQSAEERTRFVDLLKRGGGVRNEEVTLRRRSGEARRFLLSSELIELHGKPCSVTVGDDITDRKRTEDELRRSHAFLRQVIDADPNFIFAKDREGRFTMANKAVADCYGTAVENLIGQSEADFNPNWEEVEFSRQTDLQVMNSSQEYFIAEEKITDWSGETRWLQTVKRPILDVHGQVHMVLGAATDITERRQMEEMLLQREQDLSAALQERERISQDLHDGILQSLYGVGLGLENCKLLIGQHTAPVAEKLIATLDQAIGQLNHVMGEVRDFIVGLESHLMQGGDVSTALRTMVQSMCGSSSATCRMRIDDEAGRYLSTEQAVHLIYIAREGLSNALRHSRATRINVSLGRLIGSIRLTIIDNGIGFNPRSVQGIGHGLENMAGRSQKVGGLFAVRSEPGKGTRILFDLPKKARENIH